MLVLGLGYQQWRIQKYAEKLYGKCGVCRREADRFLSTKELPLETFSVTIPPGRKHENFTETLRVP